MTAPTSVESQGPRPELPPTLVALDRARAAATAQDALVELAARAQRRAA